MAFVPPAYHASSGFLLTLNQDQVLLKFCQQFPHRDRQVSPASAVHGRLMEVIFSEFIEYPIIIYKNYKYYYH
jgi:hypothetical protein